jgi:hypothetical protein
MKRLWPIILFACLYALGPLPSLMAVSGLGGWHKDDEHGFWVRVPEKWKQVKIPASEKHLVGKWRGPKMTVNLKKLGTASFYAESSVIWLEVKAQGGLTQPASSERGKADSKGQEEKGGELTLRCYSFKSYRLEVVGAAPGNLGEPGEPNYRKVYADE